MKVLVATDKPFAKVAVDGIRQIVEEGGHQLALLEKYTEQQQLLDAVADADAVIIRSDIASKEVMAAAPKLKIIVRAGAGYDNIDLAAATEKKIVAMNTPGQNANAVAELVFGMMVMHARDFYSGKSGSELRGKTLGVHAIGNIGRLVVALGKGFGMDVYGFDPFLSKEQVEATGAKYCASVEELYSKAQYVSLHIPATAQTKNSINYALLKTMPKGAVLINTARKEVINEAELVKLMEERKDFSYLTDIEPGNKAELEKFTGKFYATPKKLGAQTEEANINAGLAAARQIVKFFKDGDTTFQVNK